MFAIHPMPQFTPRTQMTFLLMTKFSSRFALTIFFFAFFLKTKIKNTYQVNESNKLGAGRRGNFQFGGTRRGKMHFAISGRAKIQCNNETILKESKLEQICSY